MQANIRILAAVAGILLSGVSASGKYYEAERYDATLRLDSRGGLAVTETVAFRFVVGEFTYVFRDIAATETDGIANVRASMDGRPCAEGTGAGEVEIHGSSPVKVVWHFAPILNETHTFTVEYYAAGVVRAGGGSRELIWRALPPERGYSVATSTLVVEYPPGWEPSRVACR